MITKQVINEIYKRYKKKPKSPDSLDLGLLFEKAGIEHDILIDPDTNDLIISSIPEDSPFHSIPLTNINAIVPFEEWTAIVLHSSIVFLNNKKPTTSIHLRPHEPSLWEKISHFRVAL